MGLMTDPGPEPMPGPMAGGMNAMPGKRKLPRPVAVIVAVAKPKR